jgi:hypothetical protein
MRLSDVGMRVEARLLLGALLLGCACVVIAADEERTEECLTTPRLIVADSKHEYSPPSTAMPPIGSIVLEVTVAINGTIRDVSVVEPVDSRLRRWAIEESKNLKFEPVSKACRTRLTLESRITDGADSAWQANRASAHRAPDSHRRCAFARGSSGALI